MPDLYDEVILDHVKQVKKLLNKSNVNMKVGPWTLLHITVFDNLPKMAKCLLTHGAEANARGEDDETPLHVASTRHRIEVAEVLLNYGADVNATDASGKTPLDRAIAEKDEEMVGLLRMHLAQQAERATSKSSLGWWRRLFLSPRDFHKAAAPCSSNSFAASSCSCSIAA